MTARAARWPAWYAVVLLCFAAVVISYIDRTNISVASIAMPGEFGWTETTKGFVLSAFFVGYLLLQVVSGTLPVKYGGRIVLGAAFAVTASVAIVGGLVFLIAGSGERTID